MLSHLFSFTSRVRRVTPLFSITSWVSVQPNFYCPLFSITSWDSPRDFNIFLFCCRGSPPPFLTRKPGSARPIVQPICIRSVHKPIFDLIYFQSLPRFARHAVALFCSPSFLSSHILLSVLARGDESSPGKRSLRSRRNKARGFMPTATRKRRQRADRQPCRRAFRRTRALPSTVRGPVDFRAFCRRATSSVGVSA